MFNRSFFSFLVPYKLMAFRWVEGLVILGLVYNTAISYSILGCTTKQIIKKLIIKQKTEKSESYCDSFLN
ncbi:hypothetical protein XELAEV_18020554mg [Xenopus laevis]|uniref:Uncharacterized protein n=1 Tax=Xenopus laevis TaxID=8355 RepID=A0A974D7J1_XENLA|nr:hypothetical protein XELAEV_18020554mg [Xenopus laevis]